MYQNIVKLLITPCKFLLIISSDDEKNLLIIFVLDISQQLKESEDQ